MKLPVHNEVMDACKYAATISRFKFHGMDRRFVPRPAVKTATVTFIEINYKTYAVTAHHVIEHFQKHAGEEGREHEGFYCLQPPGVVIEGPFLTPPNYPEKPPDIAICPIDRRLPGYVGKEAFVVRPEDDPEWPVSHAVVFGFPTEEKHDIKDEHGNTRLAMPCIHVLAEGRSDGQSDQVHFYSSLPEPPVVQNLSGISGGPAFWTDESSYGLVGFVKAGEVVVPDEGEGTPNGDSELHYILQRVNYSILRKWTEYIDETWESKRDEINATINRDRGRQAANKGAEGVYEAYSDAMADITGVANNPILELLEPSVRDIDEVVDDEFVDRKRTQMLRLLREQNVALDGAKSEDLVKLLGETHFYVLCKKEGIELDEVVDAEHPEFRCSRDERPFRLEVITPSFVGGGSAIEAMIEESFEKKVAMQERLAEGHSVAVSEQVIAPYGDLPRERRVTHLIQRLQEKVRANVRAGRFDAEQRFLVCNLIALPPYAANTDSILRPVYCRHVADEGIYTVTGELWMVAFARPGMLIHSEPEFSWSRGVEGTIQTTGILVDETFDRFAGIIFVVYDLQRTARTLAVFRDEDCMGKTMVTLVGDRWNDEVDSNGWCLK